MSQSSQFGRMIKLLRESHGFTLRDVEKATGISNPMLSQLETGKVLNPSALTVAKLARLYGLKTLWRLIEAIEEDNL